MIELEENRVLSVGASDVLSGLFQNKPSECFVIDLRDDEEMKSGSIQAEDGRGWQRVEEGSDVGGRAALSGGDQRTGG